MDASEKSELKPAKRISAKAAPKKAASPAKAAPKKNGAGTTTETRKSTSLQKNRTISAEERYRMTEVAAYFMAEQNNFSGNPVEYWQAAEKQINKMLS